MTEIDAVNLVEFVGSSVWHIENKHGRSVCGRSAPVRRDVIGVDYRVVRQSGQRVCGRCRKRTTEQTERRNEMATTTVKPDPKPSQRKVTKPKTAKPKAEAPKTEAAKANGSEKQPSKTDRQLSEKIAKLKKKAAGIRWRIAHAPEKNVPADRVEKWTKQLDEVNAEVAKLEEKKS